MAPASWFLLLVSAACMGPEVPDVVGQWGGVHLGLVATEMAITVTLTDTDETIGTFTLVRGASPRVFTCL